jgi:hypothetical protein
MAIKYDIPFLVTQAQYNHLMRNYPMIVAGHINGKNHYIKLWVMSRKNEIEQYLNSNN